MTMSNCERYIEWFLSRDQYALSCMAQSRGTRYISLRCVECAAGLYPGRGDGRYNHNADYHEFREVWRDEHDRLHDEVVVQILPRRW